jgi:hypothetical protein
VKFLLQPLPDHSSPRRTAFVVSRVYSAVSSVRDLVTMLLGLRPKGLFILMSLMSLDGNSVACEGLGTFACVIVTRVEHDAIRNTRHDRSTNNKP